ncbi:extracellular solute-binding protein [Paenibacillus sp. GSMTC-2017]|uniref:extracellular solute-binding protein n=1 Tax=Paenibacillus sp. GSMTC-2017 TaxID=2794350 RepID=UPI0018D9915F|nr:extracellular solute-binding protein [Paenibacillus sp. GSMTC-2017]MBH5318914.1 extracellular solute-binding protein [Paenibacillus sp. GSMTC-2017]
MKNVKKKSVFVTLVLLLAVSMLAACSGANKNTEKPVATATPASSETTATKEPEGTPAGLTGEFEVQYFVGGYGDKWWKHVLAEFQKANPELKITETAGSQINEQMRPRWIQGSPPDFVYIDGAGSNEAQMVTDNQLLDLTSFLKEAKNKDGKALLDIAIGQPTDYSGKNFTMPLVFGSWGTFYDKAWFAAQGWEKPTDFESFLAVGEKIKATGVSPYIHTGVYPYYINGGLLNSAIVSENGGDGSIISRMASLEEGVFKSEPIMKALDKIVQLRDKGFIDPGSIALNHTDSQMAFLQHKAAFIPNGLWLENEMSKDVPAGFEFDFIPSVLQDKGEKYVAIPYTASVAIAEKAKNPEAAKAFLQFIFTEQFAVDWAEMTGAIMNVKADLESSSAGPVVKTAMKYFNSPDLVVAPALIVNADVEKALQDGIIALLDKRITPAEWGERMEKAAAAARK